MSRGVYAPRRRAADRPRKGPKSYVIGVVSASTPGGDVTLELWLTK